MTTTLAEACALMTDQLRETSQTARLDAELLITYHCNLSRAFFYAHPDHVIDDHHYQNVQADVARRAKGMPMAYLLGEQEFWSLKLKVTQDTLIPRPETEDLIAWVLKQFPDKEAALTVADLGTGSGAIALALAKERPRWRIHATDIHNKTLDIARENAKTHQLMNIKFYSGDWCNALPETHYDLIISNPPYIAANDPHADSLRFEPKQALYAGATGLQALSSIIETAKAFLYPGGQLVLEHGYTQADAVKKQLSEQDYDAVASHRDLGGQWRFTTAQNARHPGLSPPVIPAQAGIQETQAGLLLINLGTPDAPTTSAVRRYLREFLSDPLVIDLLAPLRFLLLYGVILPTRPRQSAKAYQKIWTDAGSPLRVHSEALEAALQDHLDDQTPVALGMRYGNPSIESAIDRLLEQQCDTLRVLPLFPQYAAATTQSAIEAVSRIVSKHKHPPHIDVLPPFYADPGFIKANAEIIRSHLSDITVDRVLLSYHGLTERAIQKTGCAHFGDTCQSGAPCPAVMASNQDCYRAQCFATSRAIAHELGWPPDFYRVCFQSRLGRTPWIQPYTDVLLNELREEGVKNIAIACPAFVADCLETLEEIGIRARDQWKGLGGESFTLIPCLNSHPAWIKALTQMCLGVSNS